MLQWSIFVLIGAFGVSSFSAQPALPPTVAGVDTSRLKAMAKEIALECQNSTGASDEDLRSIKNRKIPTSRAGLCMLECFFNKAKIMQNGKFYKAGMIQTFEPIMLWNPPKMKRFIELADQCEVEIGDGDADKCKNAKLVVECITKNANTFGFTLPKVA